MMFKDKKIPKNAKSLWKMTWERRVHDNMYTILQCIKMECFNYILHERRFVLNPVWILYLVCSLHCVLCILSSENLWTIDMEGGFSKILIKIRCLSHHTYAILSVYRRLDFTCTLIVRNIGKKLWEFKYKPSLQVRASLLWCWISRQFLNKNLDIHEATWSPQSTVETLQLQGKHDHTRVCRVL